MGALFAYILKSGICLALFYLFYRLLLSKETFHRFNRIALLGVLSLSILLPAIKYTYATTHITEPTVTDISLNQIVFISPEYLLPLLQQKPPTPEEPAAASIYLSILLLIYLAGVCFFFIQTGCSFFKLFRLTKTKYPPLKEGNLKIYITEKKYHPLVG